MAAKKKSSSTNKTTKKVVKKTTKKVVKAAKKDPKILIIVLVVVLVLAGIGVGGYFLYKHFNEKNRMFQDSPERAIIMKIRRVPAAGRRYGRECSLKMKQNC